VDGFLAEIDRMQLEVREYFSSPPAQEQKGAGEALQPAGPA
jgi:hypothetical protein